LYKSLVKRAEDEDSFTEALNRDSDDEEDKQLPTEDHEKPKNERNIPIEELLVKRVQEQPMEEKPKKIELRRSLTLNQATPLGSPVAKPVKVGVADPPTSMQQTAAKSFNFPAAIKNGGGMLASLNGFSLNLPKDDRVIFALASAVLAVLLLTCFYLIIQN
jgi:hypothetical protein